MDFGLIIVSLTPNPIRVLLMALETVLNSQITDPVTQANVKTLGDAPAMANG